MDTPSIWQVRPQAYTLICLLFCLYLPACSSIDYMAQNENIYLINVSDSEAQTVATSGILHQTSHQGGTFRVSKGQFEDTLGMLKKIQGPKKPFETVDDGYAIETINLIWQNANDGSQACGLSTPTVQVVQHNYATQVWFSIKKNSLWVNATTPIDIDQQGVGLLDEYGKLMRFSRQAFADTAVWSGDLQDVLAFNDQIKVVLGGEELGRKQQKLILDLEPLKLLYPSYMKCVSMQARQI